MSEEETCIWAGVSFGKKDSAEKYPKSYMHTVWVPCPQAAKNVNLRGTRPASLFTTVSPELIFLIISRHSVMMEINTIESKTLKQGGVED